VDEEREIEPGGGTTAGDASDRGASDDALYATLRDGAADAAARRSAFEALFDRWHGKVFAWCKRVLGDSERAADRTQEVFVDLLEKPLPYARRRRFGAWLYVLVRNRCLNDVKREARRSTDELERLFADLAANEDNPLDAAGRSETAERVRRACAEVLDAREQEIVYLRYHWGLKIHEITSTLGLENASGARTYLRNAEQKLRKALHGLREGRDEGGRS
jgi:RNA polymerase sigma-70 factor (ECF subfamily)